MKEVTQYKCEKCGYVWSTAELAEKCEKSHLFPVRVMLPKNFKLGLDDCHGVPEMVIVEMNNGEKFKYAWEGKRSAIL